MPMPEPSFDAAAAAAALSRDFLAASLPDCLSATSRMFRFLPMADNNLNNQIIQRLHYKQPCTVPQDDWTRVFFAGRFWSSRQHSMFSEAIQSWWMICKQMPSKMKQPLEEHDCLECSQRVEADGEILSRENEKFAVGHENLERVCVRQ